MKTLRNLLNSELINYKDNVSIKSESHKDCFDRIQRFFDTKPKNKLILDLGCGGGGLTGQLAKDNIVIGVDLLLPNLINAKKKGLIPVNSDLSLKLPFKPNSFDIIICLHVIEHLRDPERFLIRVRDLLKKDGFLLVAVPNEFDLLQRIKILFGKSGIIHWTHNGLANPSNYFHIRFFKLKEFKELCNNAGFSIISEQYIAFYNGLNKILKHLPLRIYEFLLKKDPDLLAWDFSFKLCKQNSLSKSKKVWGLIRAGSRI